MAATPSPFGGRLPHLKLDPNLYNPPPEEVEFFKAQTGIEDDKELKAHIIAVQKEAWDVSSFVQIQGWITKDLGMSDIGCQL